MNKVRQFLSSLCILTLAGCSKVDPNLDNLILSNIQKGDSLQKVEAFLDDQKWPHERMPFEGKNDSDRHISMFIAFKCDTHDVSKPSKTSAMIKFGKDGKVLENGVRIFTAPD